MSNVEQLLNLQRAATRPEGKPPSPNNFVATAIAERWHEKFAGAAGEDLDLAIPDAGPYRASFANVQCDRALWWEMKKFPQSDPPTIADTWRFGLGHRVHEMLQMVAVDLFVDRDDCEFIGSEINVDLRPIGLPGSAHLDLGIVYQGKKTAIEIKSLGGYAFKRAVSTWQGPPEGPKHPHVVQGAVAGAAWGAEQLVIAYLSLENLGKWMAVRSEADRFAAEWHYTIESLQPLIDHEVARVAEVLDHDTVPDPVLRTIETPEGAVVNAPNAGPDGMWVVHDQAGVVVDSGKTWMCGYCSHRQSCTELTEKRS